MVLPWVAQRNSYGTGAGVGHPLYDFIGGGCTTTMKYGPNPPSSCSDFVGLGETWVVELQARFSESAHNTTQNGCTFMCPGGTCRVRGGDALPVELMHFGVE